MTIGASIALAAVGAILRYAIEDNINGIDLAVVGMILIIAGVVGLVAGIALAMSDRGGVDRDRDRRVPGDRY